MILLKLPSRLFKIERPARLFGVGFLVACSLYLHKINPYVILLQNWSFLIVDYQIHLNRLFYIEQKAQQFAIILQTPDRVGQMAGQPAGVG